MRERGSEEGIRWGWMEEGSAEGEIKQQLSQLQLEIYKLTSYYQRFRYCISS